MDLHLTHPTRSLKGLVQLPLSKSVLNRYLLLHHMGGGLKPDLSAYSLAEDSTMMYTLLWGDGSERMRQRPIAPLVEALRLQGAQIEYRSRKGCLPLVIYPPKPASPPPLLRLPPSLSSQFFSALALTGCCWPEGLRLEVPQDMVSQTYFYMSLQALSTFDIPYRWEDELVYIPKGRPKIDQGIFSAVPADWSAAAFVYGLAALSDEADIYLPNLQTGDAQGDAVIRHWAAHWGVHTSLTPNGCHISKTRSTKACSSPLRFDVRDTPDLFPVLAVLCAASGRPCVFDSIAHLRYKESDRIRAIREGLAACGVPTRVDAHRFYVDPPSQTECVRKSFPQWFDQCQKLGFQITDRPR